MTCCAVLVNFHGAAETAAAAWSLHNDAPDTEISVVDNSTDAAEFRLLMEMLPPIARAWAAPRNLGFGQACNAAIENSSAAFIFLINPDVRIVPKCRWILDTVLQKNEQFAAVAPMQFLDMECTWRLPPSWFPTPLRAWATDVAQRDRELATKMSLALRSESLRYWQSSQTSSQRAVSGGAVMIRRSALDDGQALFDPRFFMYFEDSELCWRFKRKGLQIGVAPTAHAVHLWRNQPHKSQMMAESAEIYYAMHGGNRNPWLKKLAAVVTTPALSPLLSAGQPFPTEGYVIDAAWGNKWLFELSLSPLLSPAIGLLGAGPTVPAPNQVLSHFEGARVYGRLSPAVDRVTADNCVYFDWHAG